MSLWRGCGGTGRFLHWIKEGGSRGKHGFPRGSEPKASDGQADFGSVNEILAPPSGPFSAQILPP
jgi:hypothetical protein